jgi:8-oxo-dGTP pyrophosphatase MutT (NUDIX family)
VSQIAGRVTFSITGDRRLPGRGAAALCPERLSCQAAAVPMSPHLRRIRELIGNEVLALPTVAVLPRDDDGRVLLVHSNEGHGWITIGGGVEVDESPQDAAIREAREEAGIEVGLTRLLTVVGGAGYRLTYPNGDQVSPVGAVWEARIEAGTPTPDHDETNDVRWFTVEELADLDTNAFTQRLFAEVLPLL